MVSPLESAIQFFKDFGLFDVVLPFLLVFTIVYAILEKTKLLGTVKTDKDKEIGNKNLNSMVAFVIGLLVVATANVVRAINESLPNIILLMVVVISFLILISVFWKTEEMDFAGKHKGWYRFFMIVLFIAVIAIFLNAIYVVSNGVEYSLLLVILDWIINNWGGAVFASIIMLLVVVGAILLITRGPGKKEG
ncbi:MAG: hypothetical protein KJ674_03015 [Nanoarchaeota archaeon]|nr:hypothetical protein [Nanoarchaeota archaeon]